MTMTFRDHFNCASNHIRKLREMSTKLDALLDELLKTEAKDVFQQLSNSYMSMLFEMLDESRALSFHIVMIDEEDEKLALAIANDMNEIMCQHTNRIAQLSEKKKTIIRNAHQMHLN